MAEGGMVSKVEDIVTCAMCLEILEDPQTLNCLHSYCRKCLEPLEKCKDPSEGYSCPECRRFTSLKDVRVVHLVIQLLDAYSFGKKANESTPCQKCSSKPAAWYCTKCVRNQSFCDDCKITHDEHVEDFGESHTVSSMSEVKEKSFVVDKPIYCKEHQGNKLEVYCTECEKVVCVLCKIFHHDGHKAEPVDDALKRLLPKVQASVDQIKEVIKLSKRNLAEERDKEQGLKMTLELKTKELRQCMEEEITKIRTEYAMKLEKLQNDHSESEKKFKANIQSEENEVSHQQTVLNWAELSLLRSKGVTLLQELQGGLLKQIEHICAKIRHNVAAGRCFSNKYTLHKTVDICGLQGAHPSTRASFVWNKICVLNHNNNSIIRFDENQQKHDDIRLNDIRNPRAVVQINDEQAIIVAKSGLHLVDNVFSNIDLIAAGDFSDACLKEGLVHALLHEKGEVESWTCSLKTWEKKKNIVLQGYETDNRFRNNCNYRNTLVAHSAGLFVCMVNNHAIFQYDYNGIKLKRITSGDIQYPSICGIYQNKHLLVCDYNKKCIRSVSFTGDYEKLIMLEQCPWFVLSPEQDVLWILTESKKLLQYVKA